MEALLHCFVRRRTTAATRWHAQRAAAAAIDFMLEIEDAALLLCRCRDDDRARAIAEQHAGRAVLVIDDARHDVGADDKCMVVGARCDHLARRRQRVRKGGTRGADIEAPCVVRADLFLNQTRRARKHHVGRDRPDDDQTDVVRRQAGTLDRECRRLFAQIGRRDTLVDDVPLADADALHDPLVVGVDDFLEIRIRQHLRRHVRRQRRNLGRPSPDPPNIALYHSRESLLRSSGASRPK